MLGIVTIVVSATVLAVVLKARDEAGRQAALRLRSAADTAREILKFRGTQLTTAVEVLVSDFGFKEAIASADSPTLLSVIKNHRARIGADVLIVLDPDGRLVASTLTLSAGTQDDLQSLIAGDTDGQMLRLYRLIDGRPYQLVIAPVLAPDPIGWAAMGFALNDAVATDMAHLLGVEVSFVTQDRDGTGVASSLPMGDRRAPGEAFAGASAMPLRVHTPRDDFLSWKNPIRSANAPLALILQQSLSSAERPYHELRASILGIGLVILAVAGALAVLFARGATRPVEDLTRAVERLEAGDYGTPLPIATTTEVARLASAFTSMREAVAERERIIRHQAWHDPLTGLPTRARMSELLDTMLAADDRQNSPLTTCVVEILQWENIIGSLGHAAADEMLRAFARRLASGDGMSERVARIGSNQFFLVLQGVAGHDAEAAGRRIGDKLRTALEYAGVSLQLETRIGVSVYPEDGSRAADLLQRAELALYRAKETAVPLSSFVRGDDEVHRHRLEILGDLRRAIAADELELHYQPKVSMPLGTLVGCEALVRWRHRKKGLVPPSEFIPHAERTGLIRELTTWVLGAALRQQRLWQQAGLALDVSINVSPADLADAGFAESVLSLLAQTGADATQVVLEVTESGAMGDLPKTLQIMEHLRVVGIRFSIDDFGTGYSSLAHLRRLPVNELKIDRSFVRELETGTADDVILRSTIELGHALDLKVVAEGVENVFGWDALAQLGCDLVQGYFVSKPLPAMEFSRWASQRRYSSSDICAPAGPGGRNLVQSSS
ncbi:MAG TPA: EAL domain-containing protein [Steroidobacteraceae bacterium]|nr:EAL domain-containing protein [Steroidobacteraceae bacterium]